MSAATGDRVDAEDPAVHRDQALAAFAARYGPEDPDGVWAAPGRVNLIGEHLDYNGGRVLPFALPFRCLVVARRRDDGRFRLASAQDDAVWEGGREDLVPGAVPGWAGYAAGVLWALLATGADVPGLDLLVDGRVPVGAGLSSSAALTCSVALAAADLAGAPGVDADDDDARAALAAVCVRAENEFAGAPTGGMDQAVAMRARAGHALLLDCSTMAVEHLPLVGADLLVVDTRSHHSLVDGQYGSRRQACERAADALGVTALADVPPDGLPERLAGLEEELVRMVRHVVTEVARVDEVVDLLHAGRLADTGPALLASHASMRDDFRISTPELDLVVEAAVAAGALGARMTGGGFGGSAVVLCTPGTTEAVGEQVAVAFAAAGFRPPGLLRVGVEGPAGRVG